jgi:hypothetical protein
MPEPAADGATMVKERSAFSEAGRRTYGVVYWSLTVLLTLATVASWLWGTTAARFAVSATAIAFVIVVGAVHHLRMNRIARDRDDRER